MCCLFPCCGHSDDDDNERGMNKVNRSCTDVCFLFLFLTFCGGLMAVTMYGMERGDPYRILYGSDSFGNTCGRENAPLSAASNESIRVPLSGSDMKGKSFLFPLDFRRPLSSLWVCVEACPKEILMSHGQIEMQNISLCVDDSSTRHARIHTNDGHCPVLPVHSSTPILNRCLPDDLLSVGMGLATEVINVVKDVDWVRTCVSSVMKSSLAILQSIGLAVVLSLSMVFLLRFLAPVAVYFVYFLVILVFTGISGGLWYAWWAAHGRERFNWDGTETTKAPLVDHARTTRLAEYYVDANGEVQKVEFPVAALTIGNFFDQETTVSEQALIGLALGSSVITIFIVVFTWCLLPRGKLLVNLFKQAGQALSSMPFLLVQPLSTAVAVLLVGAYSAANALLVYTAAQPVPLLHNDTTLAVVTYNVTSTQKYMLAYQAVGFIWLVEFAFAYQRMLIAGAVAKWYFDRSARNPVCGSRWNTIRYHLGSLALGSFIITLVRIPRYILMYIYAKMKASENVVVQKLFACCICTLGCIEKCLNYLNYNAYTVIAYTGQSFCPAAKTAVNVLLDNAVHVATINSIGSFVLFLSKAAVAAASAALCLLLIKDDASIANWWPQLVIVGLASYQVANCFVSVYEMVIDALFLCIAEDFSMERDGASQRRHQPEMMDYMERTIVHEESMRSRSGQRRGPGTKDEQESFEMH
ncbi:hypothetical protein PFISCL1PPCAC_4344 [Pristionchus fissidentatus]|uniref:Choline transporter-like protein n=1 Tax=Pristionchus fissidentatus TaxID=1538716 RepID=A0AAV5V421_9BILA|nr:hypothetical protein PFISCL1PPCAC_4344 [Pristionchus fissidentatus]